jgi:predicted small lipoprotein YifL
MRAPLATCIVAALVLAGCGQKGPLVLPDKKKPTPVAAPAAAAPAEGTAAAPKR